MARSILGSRLVFFENDFGDLALCHQRKLVGEAGQTRIVGAEPNASKITSLGFLSDLNLDIQVTDAIGRKDRRSL